MRKADVKVCEESFKFADESIDFVLMKHEQCNGNLFLVPSFSKSMFADDNLLNYLAEKITMSGGTVLTFHAYWNDLEEESKAIREGRNIFAESDNRINKIIERCLEYGLNKGGNIILVGISRFGFMSLHALSQNSNIKAVVGLLPVTYWPVLKEFAGMESNFLIRKHDLASRVQYFDQRDILILVTQNDERVSTTLGIEFAKHIKLEYEKTGSSERCDLKVIESQGHQLTTRIIDDAIDWLIAKKYL